MSSEAAILHLAWCVAVIDKKKGDSSPFTPEDDTYHSRIRDFEKISIT